MSDPTTVNQPAAIANTVIDDVVKGVAAVEEVAAEAALDAAVPFFALPVIHQVSDELIHLLFSYVAGKLSIALQRVGTFVIIDTQVGSEKQGISTALAALIVAEKSGDLDAIYKAIKDYADAQSALIHDDGSAPFHT